MFQSLQRAALGSALALTATACAPDAPTVPASRNPAATVAPLATRRVDATLLSVLTTCDPLPYASAAGTFGPAGGELRIGPHRLTIPRGALRSPTLITGEAPVSTAVLVKFSPDGLQFARQATLTLSYRHCARSPSLVATIVQVDDALGILGVLPSRDLPTGEVSAPLRHFSAYAVAW